MKDKGFTLTELLVAIVLFTIVMVVAIPNIISVVDRNRQKQFQMFADNIESSAEEYATENRNLYTATICNPKCVIDVRELIKLGYVDGDLRNPLNQQKLSNSSSIVVLTFVDGKPNFEFKENVNEL